MLYPVRKPAAGFSLIELLMVIICLAVLAVIAVPQFANASGGTRVNSLATVVQTVRAQVGVYKLQHGDQLPDLATASADREYFRPLMETSVHGTPPRTYGPYLLSVPVNPLTGGSVVNNVVTYDAQGRPQPVPDSDFLYDYAGGAGTGMIWGTTDRSLGAPLIQ